MSKLWIGSTLAGVFALLVVHTALPYDDDDVSKARKTILDLAKMIEKGEKGVSEKAAAAKKGGMELEPIMHSYKPSTKKGIGVGKPGAGDGIELKINSLGKRALSKMALSQEKDDLIKMAHINIAIGELTMHYAPEKPKGGKGPKEWKQYTKDMISATEAFVKAVKADDLTKIKAAANDIATACNNCHADFRDS